MTRVKRFESVGKLEGAQANVTFDKSDGKYNMFHFKVIVDGRPGISKVVDIRSLTDINRSEWMACFVNDIHGVLARVAVIIRENIGSLEELKTVKPFSF